LALKNITTPDLGGATDVTVIEVLVKPGDAIAKDAPVITLESDKATLEIPASDAGTVKEIKVKVGDKVSMDSVLLTVETGAAEAKPAATKEEPKKEEPKKEAKTESKKQPEEAPKAVLTGELESDGDIHAGPGVRRLAREMGVNLSQLAGTGPKQRILKEDVQLFVKSKLSQLQNAGTMPATLAPAPAIDFSKFGAIESQPLSRIKKISGKNLQRNWMTIPHVTQFGEADITTLEEFRQSQKAELEKQKIKLTPLVFVMKAVVASLKAFPHFNASLDPSGENLIMKKFFHIGVAVDTPDGLVVPVIRDVDKKGLIELAQELAQVSEKARKKQLTPGDMQGGCFSISSLGGIGGTAFTPIINAPEVAILGVSKSTYKPIYDDGEFVPRLMVPLSLSYDHRVIDGADGARFMVHLINMLSDIRNLLL
jgi:pyruvate dehydrogenase E2 component (dihydrolipoamide acetyltransferase)